MRRLNTGGIVGAQLVSHNAYFGYPLSNCFLLKPVSRRIFRGSFFGRANGFSLAKTARRISSPFADQIARSSASAAALTHNSSASMTCPRRLLDSARRASMAFCSVSRDEFKQKRKRLVSFGGMGNYRATGRENNRAIGLGVIGLLPRRGEA